MPAGLCLWYGVWFVGCFCSAGEDCGRCGDSIDTGLLREIFFKGEIQEGRHNLLPAVGFFRLGGKREKQYGFRLMCATFAVTLTDTLSATSAATISDTRSDTFTVTDTDTLTYTLGDTLSDTYGDTFGDTFTDTFSATFSVSVRHLFRHLF